MGEILIFPVKYDYLYTNAVIKILLCVFSYIYFFIFCDAVYIVLIFLLVIINEMLEFSMQKSYVSFVFPSFSYMSYSLISVNSLLYFL